MPHLLLERPFPLQVVLAIVVPALFGAITGALLGVTEIGYLVLSLLGILGGLGAGLEHPTPREGALRGLGGGALFGTFILFTAAAIGDEAKAHLPEPQWILVVITTFFGVVLGALGGRIRRKREGRAPGGHPAH